MIKYWVIGTSTKKYLQNFIRMLIENDISIGYKLIPNISDPKKLKLIHDEDVVFSEKSKATFNQNIDVWLGVGLIRKNNGKYLVINDEKDLKKLIHKTKWNLLEIDLSNSKESSFRLTKLINALIYANKVTFDEIENHVSQKRGTLTLKKIKKEVSLYEKILAKENYFLKKALEVINDYK